MGMSKVVPALPVRDIDTAVEIYVRAFGFTTRYTDPTFARLTRDDVEIHLWAADDDSWNTRSDPAAWPVCSGAETFLAGTASCRIAVDEINDLYAEMSARECSIPQTRVVPSRRTGERRSSQLSTPTAI